MKIIPRQISTADWPLFPRQVQFDWKKSSPFHWIPQSPIASHAVNHFSFTLVRGEYFFCQMFNKALPYITDEKLKKDVEVFIRQEAIHAQAHKISIEQYLQKYGVDIEEHYNRAAQIFDFALADQPFGITIPKTLEKQWLMFRIAIVAAAEHYTCALGQYVLTKAHWEARGCDPVVSDLFTWHSAEEVEHRTVAFDLFQHLSGSYAMRSIVMAGLAPIFTGLMVVGTTHLAQSDPELPKSQKGLLKWGFWKEWQKAANQHFVPSPWWFIQTSFRYFKRDYHPYHEGSTELAVNYINQSAGVIANRQAVS